MISLRRTNQGGSVHTFLIVAVILTIVLIGAARYVQQRGAQVRRDQAIAAADKQGAASQPTPSSSTDNQGTSSAPGTSSANSAAQQASPAADTGTPAASSALPTTGPGLSSIISMVMAGILVGVTTAYVLSLRVAQRPL